MAKQKDFKVVTFQEVLDACKQTKSDRFWGLHRVKITARDRNIAQRDKMSITRLYDMRLSEALQSSSVVHAINSAESIQCRERGNYIEFLFGPSFSGSHFTAWDRL